MVFVGVDWAEAHHDLCLVDEQGKRRIPDGLQGVRRLHELVCEHAEEPEQVVGIETDRGLLVRALLAAGYQVYAVNPLAVSRYRDRHTTSRAKSDAGDAKLLADLVRTDRHNHRPIAGDSELAGAIQVLARAHQNLVWSRQRHVNQLRNTLREFYPGALEAFSTDLAGVDAVTILERAPTPHRVAPSPRPRSSPRCAKPAVSATWSSRRPRSRATCGLPSWRSRPCSPRPTAAASPPAFACYTR